MAEGRSNQAIADGPGHSSSRPSRATSGRSSGSSASSRRRRTTDACWRCSPTFARGDSPPSRPSRHTPRSHRACGRGTDGCARERLRGPAAPTGRSIRTRSQKEDGDDLPLLQRWRRLVIEPLPAPPAVDEPARVRHPAPRPRSQPRVPERRVACRAHTARPIEAGRSSVLAAAGPPIACAASLRSCPSGSVSGADPSDVARLLAFVLRTPKRR